MKKKVGLEKRNCRPEDYKELCLLWTCSQAIKKIISSSAFKTYPDYIQESLEERAKVEEKFTLHPEKYSSDSPPRIGLPMGMEFLSVSDLQGREKKTAEFIVNEKLIAIAVKKRDWDKIKVPPGFITELSFKLLTDIPKK